MMAAILGLRTAAIRYGRGSRIRTYGLLLPKQTRYQAALYPVPHSPNRPPPDRQGAPPQRPLSAAFSGLAAMA